MLYGGGDFLGKAAMLICYPIIASVLSVKDFGVLELLMTTTALMAAVANCGLNNSAQRYYWDSETLASERPALVSSGFFALVAFNIGIGVLGILLSPLFLRFLETHQSFLSYSTITAAVVLMVASQGIAYLLDTLRLHAQPLRFLFVSLGIRLGVAVAGVFVVKVKGWGLEGFVLSQLVVNLLFFPVAAFYVRKDLRLKIDTQWSKKLISYGYPFIFASLAFWVFASLDRWMLASLSSVEEVGIYSVSLRFASVVLLASSAFGLAWSPFAIKVKTDYPDSYRKIYGQVLKLLLYGMILVAGSISVFAGEIISSLMPKEYYLAALPLIVLCVGIVFQATQNVTALGISLEKKTHLFGKLTWVAAILNAILNFLFIPRFGAVGAAMATCISYLVLTSSYFYYTQKLHSLHDVRKGMPVLAVLFIAQVFVSVNFLHYSLDVKIIAWKLLFLLLVASVGFIALGGRKIVSK